MRMGAVSHNPLADVKDAPQNRGLPPKFVPPEDVLKLLNACTSDRNWAFLSIVAFNSLRVSELLDCNVSDFQLQNGRPILHFKPGRKGEQRRASYVVLANESAAALERYLGKRAGRRNGALFQSRDGERLSRPGTASGIFVLTAERAGLGYTVTPDMVANSLPVTALRQGFSYRGLVRAVGVPDRKYSQRWRGVADGPEQDNASLRFARLVLNSPDTPENMLLHVESLLYETDLPEPFTVMAAGSIVERHLRLLSAENEIPLPNDDTKGNIGYYVGELQRRKIVSVTAGRRIRALGDLRNYAAHGRFELVPEGSGAQTLREARDFILRNPLAEI
jgi:hypothetical protein